MTDEQMAALQAELEANAAKYPELEITDIRFGVREKVSLGPDDEAALQYWMTARVPGDKAKMTCNVYFTPELISDPPALAEMELSIFRHHFDGLIELVQERLDTLTPLGI